MPLEDATPVVPPVAPAAGEPAPAAEPSLEQFIAESDAADAGVSDDAPAAEGEPEAAPAAPAPADKPADAPPVVDEVKAARAIRVAAAKAQKAADAKATAGAAEMLALFKTNPSKFLAQAGVSVDDFLLSVTSEGEPPAAPKAEDRIGALEKLLADQKAANEAAASQREVDAARARVTELVKADAAKFPLINRSASHALVSDLMVQYYERHSKPLDPTKAAAEVESYLKTLAGEPAAPTPKAAPVASAPRVAAPTLAALSARDAPPVADGLPMDEDARMRAVNREIAQLQ